MGSTRSKAPRNHECLLCPRKFHTFEALNQHSIDKHDCDMTAKSSPPASPDWEGECLVCGAKPIVVETGMCGPCTFGEADTVGGNW